MLRIKSYVLISIIAFICSNCNSKEKRMPEFKILLVDSSTVLNTSNIPKGTVSIFVYFSSDCDLCKHDIKLLLQEMNELKYSKFYLITGDSFSKMRVFSEEYSIGKYNNIVLGKDYQWSFFKLFNPATTPYLVFFDKQKRLRAIYSGGTEVSNIISTVKRMSK
jgi:hypothetical protein